MRMGRSDSKLLIERVNMMKKGNLTLTTVRTVSRSHSFSLTLMIGKRGRSSFTIPARCTLTVPIALDTQAIT